MKTQENKTMHTPKLSFDGHGFNDADNEYRERIATLSAYGLSLPKEKMKAIETAVNAHEELVKVAKGFVSAYELGMIKAEGKADLVGAIKQTKEALTKAGVKL